MIRTALQPKWLAALLLAVLFAAICGRLGAWQLEEARAEARAEAIEQAAALPVSPITQVVAPQSEFPPDGSTRRITATGTYAPEHQFLVTDRRLDGTAGYWVVTPLVVAETGASLPVLRGFVTDVDAAPRPPAGEVAIAGGLAPSESPVSEADLPAGVYRSIDLSRLVNEWDTEVYNAFVFATDEQVDGRAVDLDGLTRVPPPTGESSELNLKNAMYAVQWWVFAAFGFFLWWRAVRQEHREERAATTGATSASGSHPAGDKAPTERADPARPDPDRPDPYRPDPGQPDPEQPDTDQPDTDQPDTDQPDTDQPDTDKPDTDQARADATGATHTLSTIPTSRSR
jgi:surfeit locus 1 family protein